jgi:hypothetical protein
MTEYILFTDLNKNGAQTLGAIFIRTFTRLGCREELIYHPSAIPLSLFLPLHRILSLLETVAGTTGLEPATSAVTVNWKRVTHWKQA